MRLVVVSNRLPTIVAWRDGELQLKGTAGGLVSGNKVPDNPTGHVSFLDTPLDIQKL